MKDQYFGDVNDFVKYGVLRTLQRTAKLSLGICWCLTADDGTGHGELRGYLDEPDRWRKFDRELFENLLPTGSARAAARIARPRMELDTRRPICGDGLA